MIKRENAALVNGCNGDRIRCGYEFWRRQQVAPAAGGGKGRSNLAEEPRADNATGTSNPGYRRQGHGS